MNISNKTKNRDLSFDFVKGVLIFLVVYGHSLNELHSSHTQSVIDVWINSFHMPLFMFVSGWFATHSLEKGIVRVSRKMLMRLFVPALLWSTVIFTEKFVYGNVASPRLFYESMRGAWFLWCLLGLYLMVSFLWRIPCRIGVILLVSLLLYVLWPYYPNDFLKHFKIPHFFLVFCLGALCTPPYSLLQRHRNKIVAICTFIYIICLVGIYGKFAQEREYLLRGMMFIASVLPYCMLLRHIYSIIQDRTIGRIFVKLGSATLGIYMTNELLIHTFQHQSFFPTDNELLILLIAIMVTSVCYVLTILLRTNKWTKKLLLGEVKK